jgi:predicted metalloendopeptidase
MKNITKRKKTINNKTQKKHELYISFEKDYSTKIPISKIKISNELINKHYVKNLEKAFNIPKEINTKNDFYSYINYHWLQDKKKYKNNEGNNIKYLTEIDNTRILQNQVFLEINELIKNYIKNNNSKESENLKNYYESAYSLNSEKDSIQNVKEFINYLDELRLDKKNIWKLLAYLNKFEFIKTKTPIVWNIVPNPYNNKKFITKISPKIFSIISFYKRLLNYSEEEKEISTKDFMNHLKKLFISLTPNNSYEYKNVLAVLNELHTIKEKGSSNSNTIITTNDALTKYGFDFKEFAINLGYKKIPDRFLCENIYYLENCTKILLEKWNSEYWRGYWIWVYIRNISRLTKNFDKIFFDYYGKKLNGQKEVRPPNIIATTFTCIAFNKLINELYLEKSFDKMKVDYIQNLSADLKIVFKRIISRNDWMSKKTKKYALEKLNALEIMIITPPKFADDPPSSISYKKNEFLNNIIKYSFWRSNYLINLINNPIYVYPIVSWSSYPIKFISYQSYIVNASYIPSSNKIYIPAAYIQKPFIDLDNRSLSYNLATIGFTIAHELSHSLDDYGSKFDKYGNLYDWWSEEDKEKYIKIQESIIKQYDDWAKRDGLKYNSSNTIGEDIADISGLAICNELLRDYLALNSDSVPTSIATYQLFFIHFAVNLRQKLINQESQLLINPHPPDKYRCNVPLSRSILFRAIYDVKKGDKMWWPSTNQVW